jgi:branched-subunit amino acid transport protein
MNRNVLGIILLTAALTYLLRALPLAIFRKPFRSRFWATLLETLPYALLSAMIFPSIFYSTGESAYPAMPSVPAAAGAITALALGFMRRSLPTVALAATAVAYTVACAMG